MKIGKSCTVLESAQWSTRPGVSPTILCKAHLCTIKGSIPPETMSCVYEQTGWTSAGLCTRFSILLHVKEERNMLTVSSQSKGSEQRFLPYSHWYFRPESARGCPMWGRMLVLGVALLNSSSCFLSYNNQECFQTLPRVPWYQNHCQWEQLLIHIVLQHKKSEEFRKTIHTIVAFCLFRTGDRIRGRGEEMRTSELFAGILIEWSLEPLLYLSVTT